MIYKITTILLVLIYSQTISATKECRKSPCIINNKFSETVCRSTSSWIATGEIKDVVSNIEGHPLNKDFATFKLKVKNWEKGQIKDLTIINFKVGWCNNQKELPKNKNGLFRFYGKSINSSKEEGYYLYFVKVKE